MNKKENKIITTEYKQWLTELKQNFRKLQIKASIQVNSILLEFYWKLGNEIIKMEQVVPQLFLMPFHKSAKVIYE